MVVTDAVSNIQHERFAHFVHKHDTAPNLKVSKLVICVKVTAPMNNYYEALMHFWMSIFFQCLPLKYSLLLLVFSESEVFYIF